MKQTAVELLMESILGKDFRLTCSDEQLNAYQQAKQMEAEQSKAITLQNQSESKAIPELSDEEIEEIAKQHLGDRSATNIYYWLIEGMQLYREQLNQIQ